MIELLVTGTGRCGTGYVSKLLTASGIPCGHEEVYTPLGIQNRPELVADASWCAVPFLKDFQGRIVHLVRHPLAVIRSFLGIRFFTHDLASPHRRFAARHFRRSPDPVTNAMRWWITLNSRTEAYADVRIRVEDLPGALPELVGHPIEPGPEPDRQTNHRRQAQIQALPAGLLRTKVQRMGRRYGYDVEAL